MKGWDLARARVGGGWAEDGLHRPPLTLEERAASGRGRATSEHTCALAMSNQATL